MIWFRINANGCTKKLGCKLLFIDDKKVGRVDHGLNLARSWLAFSSFEVERT
jgi:hypothetical protein